MRYESDKRLTVLIPKKETRDDLLKAFRTLGIDAPDPDREVLIEADNFPLKLVLLRDGDIPEMVDNDRLPFSLGYCGSDSAWEGLGKEEDGSDRGTEFPLYELNPEAKRSRLYIGVTRKYKKYMDGQGQGLGCLEESYISTSLPNVTRDYFYDEGVKVTPFKVGGSDEIFPLIIPDCNAVLGVISSGKTVRQVGIEPIRDPIHVVSMRELVRPEKMTRGERDIYDDLQDKVTVAREKRRWL